MNFCGTRIKTVPAENKPTKKLELLQIQEGMWACEKQVINNHNELVALQNQGCLLTSLKTLDMSFLGRLDEEKNPKFGVFSTDTFGCHLDLELGSGGKFESLRCGLPKVIGNGYRSGFKGKALSNRRRSYSLEANFIGLVPQKTKEKVSVLQKAGIKTYIIAETSWEKKEQPKPDPLVIAFYNSKVYLIDKFDASIEENYIAQEFSIDPISQNSKD